MIRQKMKRNTLKIKGHLHDFEMSFWCLQIYQKTHYFFLRFFSLASKKRLDQKINKGTLSFFNYLKII